MYMNEEIKLLPNGDFEVQYTEMREFERKIKEAMMIPAPLLDRQSLYAWELDKKQLAAIINAEPSCILCEMGVPLKDSDFEKHLPGVQESDFADVKLAGYKGRTILDDPIINCPYIPSMMSAPGVADDMPDSYLKWAIVKLNEGREYFLKKMNDDGTREWTRNNTTCRLWETEKEATEFAGRYFKPGKAGVRGLLTGQ